MTRKELIEKLLELGEDGTEVLYSDEQLSYIDLERIKLHRINTIEHDDGRIVIS